MKRNHIHQWAAALGGTENFVRDKAAILMRGLPAVSELERELLLYSDDQPRVEHRVAEASKKLFGITIADIAFRDDDWDAPKGSAERDAAEERYDQYSSQFQASEMTDDEAMDLLRPLGLDFSDDRGEPLRCTKHLMLVAEAAAKRIAGTMPDKSEISVEHFEDKMKREAELFFAKKRGAKP